MIFPNMENTERDWKRLFWGMFLAIILGSWLHESQAKELSGIQRFTLDLSCNAAMQDVTQQVAGEFSNLSVLFIGTRGRRSLGRDLTNTILCSNDREDLFELSYAAEAVSFEDHDIMSEDQNTTLATTRTWWYTENPDLIIEFDIWVDSSLAEYQYYPILWHEFGHATGEKHSANIFSLMHFAPIVSDPSIDDIASVVNSYERCEKSYRDNQYRHLFIPSLDVEGENMQLVLEHIGEMDFRVIEKSIKPSLC